MGFNAELEKDACTQSDWSWHGVRENLFDLVRAKKAPYWDFRKAPFLSNLLSQAPRAPRACRWCAFEEAECPMGEAALLVAEFLTSEDQSYLETALLLMQKTLGTS